MSASSKPFFTNALAVIIGTFSALLCFSLLSLLCFYTRLIGWTDGGSEEEIRSLGIKTTISLIVVGIISALIGGFMSRYISEKEDWLPVIITGVLLTAILSLVNGAGSGVGILLLVAFPVTLAGGWLGRKR